MSIAISARLEALDSALELSYSEIFAVLCAEFALDGEAIAADLGCRCPFALVGYLSA